MSKGAVLDQENWGLNNVARKSTKQFNSNINIGFINNNHLFENDKKNTGRINKRYEEFEK